MQIACPLRINRCPWRKENCRDRPRCSTLDCIACAATSSRTCSRSDTGRSISFCSRELDAHDRLFLYPQSEQVHANTATTCQHHLFIVFSFSLSLALCLSLFLSFFSYWHLKFSVQRRKILQTLVNIYLSPKKVRSLLESIALFLAFSDQSTFT